jgi:hypothetical protein
VSAFRTLLCAALASSVFFSASEAEARFGKRSNSSDSEKKEKKEKKKDKDDDDDDRQHRSTSSRVHDASPVGSSRPPPPPTRVIVEEPPPTRVIIVEEPYPPPPPTYYVAPPPPAYAPPPAEVYAPRQDTVYSPMRMGADGGPMGGGVGVHLFLAFEGELLGLEGRLTGLSLPTDDGTSGTDGIGLTNVHLTYALLTHERARWRVEAGVSTAHAPDITFVGPSLGTSFEGRIGGPLDAELRAQVTPFPYRQLDMQAALALKLHPWVLRAGWRTLLLDDAGMVDGEVHRDLFNGPYVGVGLNF